ncbi:MAG TPA: T9SS type A sorting domain-containing protein [Tenuifilaceae bacterium]|nr:T9SS type A sorting domain-containing protein [Tenuifilaceae bacterium]
MKKLLLLSPQLVLTLSLFGQTIITSQNHGFIPNDNNPMLLTSYVEPGPAGKNVVWNFSMLETSENFQGSLKEVYTLKDYPSNQGGNVVLEEFGNRFIFNMTANSLEQVGFQSSTGSTEITYSKPFVKMRYPFGFNSSFSGDFKGDYLVNKVPVGTISGTYRVEGDGYGKLILPGGRELSGVLRVKEVKLTTQTINNSLINIEDVTYRWYVANHRFPVLSLIKSTYTPANGKPSTQTKAAFNGNVVSQPSNVDKVSDNLLRFTTFPNPYKGKVAITYTLPESCKVNLAVYDITGKLVSVLVNGIEDAGQKTHYFSAAEVGMPAATYIVKLTAGKVEFTGKVLEVR